MSSQEDTQLNLKQEIIKAEILDKNYDKDKFLHFILSKKEHGDDLSKWSLLELNDAIVEFIKMEKGESKVEEGKKMDVLRKNNKVIFEMDCDHNFIFL